jgi:hypothetical protein
MHFDIKSNVLAGLRENQIDGRANNDPWDHLTRFSETCQIQKVPDHITEDQEKLWLFAFSIICHAKGWLQCLPNGTIQTWKELDDNFFEKFFTHNQFQKRRSDMLNFKQHEHKSLYEVYERFKLLKRKCPNHKHKCHETDTNLYQRHEDATHNANLHPNKALEYTIILCRDLIIFTKHCVNILCTIAFKQNINRKMNVKIVGLHIIRISCYQTI